MSLAIGIDLGTTTSCAYIYQNSHLNIIPLGKQGLRILPSCVYFDENEILVGVDAEKRSAFKPKLGIYDAKRMIGRKFDNDFIKENLHNWPFTVKAGPNNECQIEIQKSKLDPIITLSPEEISCEILKQIKKDAEEYTKQEIKDAVITVPAYFNDAQRRATQKAAQLANLNVLEIINEPTSAALAYAYQKEHLDRTILVYDLGGGTFDVSLVKFSNGEGQVIGKKGDCILGGRDFDNNLINFILHQVIDDLSNNEIVDNNQRIALRRLKWITKDIKERLSQTTKEVLEMDEIFDSELTLTITRQDFEMINMILFEKTIQIVNATLTDAKIEKSDIDDIVLVGGSSRIPKIRQMLEEYFEGRTLSHGINPDEAVAMGAAIRAAILNGTFDEKIKINKVQDITPYSLGIAVYGGGMSVIIPKGSNFPTKMKQNDYKTVFDNQEAVSILIFEGEKKLAKDNVKLGNFVVSGLEPKKAGKVKINVEFEIDSNNILKVTATESSNNQSNNIECVLNYS